MKSFKDLDRDELYRSCIEDFAVDVEKDANKETLIAALVETGIDWNDYVTQHPEAGDGEEETTVVTSEKVTGRKKKKSTGPINVAEPVVKNEGQYLVKMVRENLLYETRGYRFTQEHPYALVEPDDAQYILSNEDGFRQAFPSELEEFYG